MRAPGRQVQDDAAAEPARRLKAGERVDWTQLADGARLVLLLPQPGPGAHAIH
jgi:hypothetical protein